VANDCGPSHVAQLSGAPVVLVYGNWDGAARARIAEWFDPRRQARCLTTAEIAPVESIGIEHVLSAIDAAVHDSLTDPRVIEIAHAGVRSP
jgi:ADP-heptose:LPS heptosyltransferase